MSGYAEESFSDKQARIANSVFLPKPFSLTDLTSLVLDQLPPEPAAPPADLAPAAQEMLS